LKSIQKCETGTVFLLLQTVRCRRHLTVMKKLFCLIVHFLQMFAK